MRTGGELRFETETRFRRTSDDRWCGRFGELPALLFFSFPAKRVVHTRHAIPFRLKNRLFAVNEEKSVFLSLPLSAGSTG